MARIEMKPKTIFKDIEEYYAENPNRRYSGEIDYGCDWKDSYSTDPNQFYRVSYVENTGEIYAIELAYGGEVGYRDNQSNGFVAILGVIPADERKCGKYSQTLDEILDGWADSDQKISWVKERLRPHSYL